MALLACPRCYWHIGNTAQESIDEAAEMLKVFDRADEQRTLWAGSRLEVGPLGGDQRLTAVRQYEHELQAGGHPGLP